MAGSEPTTVIFHINLGDASKYDEGVFPREYYNAGNALSKGSVLLSATLEEMAKIAEMGIDLKKDPRFARNTQAAFDRLTVVEENLKNRPKSFNPFTVFRNYRAERIFLSASKSFYRNTKETSERIQREEALVQIVPSKELTTINDEVPPNATIGGIAVPLYGRDAERTVLAAINAMVSRAKDPDPFIDDPQILQHCDGESIMTLADTASLLSQDTPSGSSSHSQQTEPMSPGSAYHFHFHNSVLTAGSNVQGLTLNQGDGNQGSHMTQQPDP
ncbi:hypothetical protein JVU11DRAFT_10805 [Chiua virens]|nr:hypothetical protein JVU11DRAFT_10805 [Chiua virens]